MKQVLLILLMISGIVYLAADAIAWPPQAKEGAPLQVGFATLDGLAKLPGSKYAILEYVGGRNGAIGNYTVTIASANRVCFRIWDNTQKIESQFYICWDQSLTALNGKTVSPKNLGVKLDYKSGGEKQNCVEIPDRVSIFGFERTDLYFKLARQTSGPAANVWQLQLDKYVLRHADMALIKPPDHLGTIYARIFYESGFTPSEIISAKDIPTLKRLIASYPGLTYAKARKLSLPKAARELALARPLDIPPETAAPIDTINTRSPVAASPAVPQPSKAKGKQFAGMLIIAILVALVVLALLLFIQRRSRRRE